LHRAFEPAFDGMALHADSPLAQDVNTTWRHDMGHQRQGRKGLSETGPLVVTLARPTRKE
jgi:hypothetical protein